MGERGWYRCGWILGVIVRVWKATLRFESRGKDSLDETYILAIWHGRLLGVLMDTFDTGCVTMTSRSKDGALAAGVVEGVGLKAMRGSRSSGGREAFSEMAAAVKGGAAFAALTVDGPKGPWREVKPGVLLLARRLGIPLVPVTFSCRHYKLLSSWDRMVLPRPFSRIVVSYGKPFSPEELRGPSSEVLANIAKSIDDLTESLDRELVGRELWPPK